ncbi:hypothetical protein K1719_012079 [Acacia pycnantha]|nr:hypothetical protein K1719_012079 [Acacia pycnantha]
MADIAMLVAEEYERSVRSAKKAASASTAGGGGGSGGLSDSDERRRFEMVYTVAQGLKHKFDEERSQILSYNWVWEPRTQFSVAVSHSFFSA